MTSQHQAPAKRDAEDAALAPPPDAVNPALIDLNTTYTVTLILAALFIGAVIVFIL